MSTLLDAFDRQIGWCSQPSPFSARVLSRSRRWLASDEAAHAALFAVDADPLAAAVALRWLAGLHHLALRGLQPWAALWPPAASPVSDAALDVALDAAITLAWQTQQPALRKALSLPPQTNEVQRSAALLPGLLHVAALTPLPLALVEIGASAGLNLWCDQYRHDHGVWAWGDPASTLTLRSEWLGADPPLPLSPRLAIASRAGCDAMPIDIHQPGEGLRLTSFIWPDQPERLARLRAAQAVASACMAKSGLRVQAAHAADFVRQQLTQRLPGQALVLMHSVVWQYIPHAEQDDIRAQMAAAGSAATADAPLAWLRFEPPALDLAMELRCRFWPRSVGGRSSPAATRDKPVSPGITSCAQGASPGLVAAPQRSSVFARFASTPSAAHAPSGDDRLLARCHPHGARIEWLAGSAA